MWCRSNSSWSPSCASAKTQCKSTLRILRHRYYDVTKLLKKALPSKQRLISILRCFIVSPAPHLGWRIIHLLLYERNRKVEEIGKFIRRYSGLSSEETKNSSELWNLSSEVSFHSSEVLFRPSVENLHFLVSYWGNSSGDIGLCENVAAIIALHSQTQSSYSRLIVKHSSWSSKIIMRQPCSAWGGLLPYLYFSYLCTTF